MLRPVVLESAGGPRSRPARDYREGLGLLLSRLAAIGAVLTEGIVDSRVTQALPCAERRLVLCHGRKYPISLRSADLRCASEGDRSGGTVGQRPGAGGWKPYDAIDS